MTLRKKLGSGLERLELRAAPSTLLGAGISTALLGNGLESKFAAPSLETKQIESGFLAKATPGLGSRSEGQSQTELTAKPQAILDAVFAARSAARHASSDNMGLRVGARSVTEDTVHGDNDDKWGPETPNFNLQVILRGEGFGHVKFRQPNDDAVTIHLDVWVRDLAPNTSYLLQRAVDDIVDDNCTSTNWLTLGKGLTPQSITTDANGTGQEELFRSVAAFPVGSEFDIKFRVIHEESGAVVLTSECYQFTISQ
jgi:hypothetical protein